MVVVDTTETAELFVALYGVTEDDPEVKHRILGLLVVSEQDRVGGASIFATLRAMTVPV